MTYRLPSRTRERTLTTGTGPLDLAGVIFPNERAFADTELVDGDTTRVCILSGNGVDWEIGDDVVFNTGSPPTLTRNPTRSSNADAAIDLVGDSQVFVSLPGSTAFTDGGNWDPTGAVAKNTTVLFGETRYVATVDIPAAPAGPPLIDGHAKHNGTTSASPIAVTLTTTLPDDEIVVLIAINGGQTAVPTASGLAFTERNAGGVPIRHTIGGFTIQEFTARAAAPLAALVITITPSASADFSAVAFGANPVNPIYAFDTNSDHLPLATAGNTVDCTTDGSNLFLMYLDVSANIAFNPTTVPASFTLIEGTTYVPAQMGVSGRSVTAQQVGVALVGSASASVLAWVDALTSQNAPPNVDPRWVPLGTAFGDQVAHTFYAGPASGSDAPPGFRAMVAADLPSGTATQTYADLAAAAAVATAEAFATSADAALTHSIAGATDAAVTSPAGNDILVFIAGSPGHWTNKRPPIGFAFSSPQTTPYTASQVLGAVDVPCGMTIAANFGPYLGRSARAGGSAAATASTVISVERAVAATPNTFAQVGTITIATGATMVPTFASASGAAIVLADDDRVRFVAPATPDATFAGFYCTIPGYQT